MKLAQGWVLKRGMVQNFFTRTVVLALAMTGLTLMVAPPSPAARQAFIRVNGYYFVYTIPVVPYIDKQGAFMVGLEGLTRGWSTTTPIAEPNHSLGGEEYGIVSYDIPTRAATLTFDGHSLMFRGGSRFLNVDGQPVPMKSAAIWEPVSRQMIVPLAALTAALHLATFWDPVQRMLSVTGEGLTRDLNVSDYADLVGGEMGEAGQIVLENMRLRFGKLHGTVQPPTDNPGPGFPPQPARLWLVLTVRNVSGHNIDEGGDWINATWLSRNGAVGEYIDVKLPAVELQPTPPIRAGGTRTLILPVDRRLKRYSPLCVLCEPLQLP